MRNFNYDPVPCRNHLLVCALIYIIFIQLTVPIRAFSQTRAKIGGRWQWAETARKDHLQNGFWVNIVLQENRVRGVYSLLTWLNGELQIEDGNQTPFIGTVKGNVITITFDPDNIHPGYEQNVRYKNPTNGGRPSTAMLVMTNGKLQLALTSGKWPEESHLPRQFIMRRTK